MAGALYIWIVGAFFIGCAGVMILLIGIFWIGHWLEKKQTGATHGFLEIPEGSESRPASTRAEPPPPPSEPPGTTS